MPGAQETLATGCASTAFAVNMHVHGIAMIAGIGGPAAERAYRAIVDDGAVIAGGFSEPGVGGNWWHPTTKARTGRGRLPAQRAQGFFTGFPAADLLFLSAARTDDRGPAGAGRLPGAQAGARRERHGRSGTRRACGRRAAIRCSWTTSSSRTPTWWGQPGALPLMFMQGVHWAWCSFASVFLGIARGALETVVREQRGRTLHVLDRTVAHLPGVQFRVAEMRTRLAAAEAHLHQSVRADHDRRSRRIRWVTTSR
ncbi:hypothetical protein [Streptomyces sp. KL116D]|uniref:hypothetical protein n=1 Tax=Streptomyces sp. KL116D TaxID=3045152 RepID=UPI00355898B2